MVTSTINQSIKVCDVQASLGYQTDASAVMVTYRCLFYTVCSNGVIDWPVQSIMFSFRDMTYATSCVYEAQYYGFRQHVNHLFWLLTCLNHDNVLKFNYTRLAVLWTWSIGRRTSIWGAYGIRTVKGRKLQSPHTICKCILIQWVY